MSPQEIAEPGRDQYIHDGGEDEAEREDRLYPGKASNRDMSRVYSLGSEVQIRRSFSTGSWTQHIRQRLQRPVRPIELQLNGGN